MLVAAGHAVFAGDAIRTSQMKSCGLWPGMPAVSAWSPAAVGHGEWGLNWNWAPGNLSPAPATNQGDGKMPRKGNQSSPSPQHTLKPGVYRTSPYTLLALVPGPQPDRDWFLKSGTTRPEKMPGLAPELEFNPFKAEK